MAYGTKVERRARQTGAMQGSDDQGRPGGREGDIAEEPKAQKSMA